MTSAFCLRNNSIQYIAKMLSITKESITKLSNIVKQTFLNSYNFLCKCTYMNTIQRGPWYGTQWLNYITSWLFHRLLQFSCTISAFPDMLLFSFSSVFLKTWINNSMKSTVIYCGFKEMTSCRFEHMFFLTLKFVFVVNLNLHLTGPNKTSTLLIYKVVLVISFFNNTISAGIIPANLQLLWKPSVATIKGTANMRKKWQVNRSL